MNNQVTTDDNDQHLLAEAAKSFRSADAQRWNFARDAYVGITESRTFVSGLEQLHGIGADITYRHSNAWEVWAMVESVDVVLATMARSSLSLSHFVALYSLLRAEEVEMIMDLLTLALDADQDGTKRLMPVREFRSKITEYANAPVRWEDRWAKLENVVRDLLGYPDLPDERRALIKALVS